MVLAPHKRSIRSIQYMSTGTQLAACSADGSMSLSDLSAGKIVHRWSDEDEDDPVGLTRLFATSEDLITVGDEEGFINMYDVRTKGGPVWKVEAHADFVNDITIHEKKKILVSVGGDGTVALIDVRKGKLKAQSEDDADDEMLSVTIMQDGKKVVIGTQSGVLSIFSWGYWNDCSDRFPGHPESVDTLVKYDEDILLTGSSDGMIRILTIFPHRMVGMVGEHSSYPIERIAMNRDKTMLASASHDSYIKLWDIQGLGDDDGEDEEVVKIMKDPTAGAAVQDDDDNSGSSGVSDGNDEEDDDDDDDDDSDDDEKPKKKKKKVTPTAGKKSVLSKAQIKQKKRGSKNFFDGIL